jgi:hypothetical protein
MSSRRITFRPSAGATHEEAREKRARAWAFIFECWRAKQEGGPTTAPDNPERSSDEIRARSSIPH